MLSSARTPDRKQTPIIEDGLCSSKCPFFRKTKADVLELDMTCFNDGKPIFYYDGWQPHCPLAEEMAEKKEK